MLLPLILSLALAATCPQQSHCDSVCPKQELRDSACTHCQHQCPAMMAGEEDPQGTLRYELACKEDEISAKEREIHLRAIQAWLLLIISLMSMGGITAMAILLHQRKKRNSALMRACMLKDQLLALQPSLADNEPMKAISRELDQLNSSPSVHLSEREKEIARYCSEGLSAKEIAEKLHISTRTVESHKNNIFRKLGISSTVDLVLLMGKIQND